MPRGRPPRAGRAATERIEIRCTLEELRGYKRLAEANHCSLADVIRDQANLAAADCGEAPPAVVSSGRKSGAGRC